MTANQAATRASLYRLLALAFDYPRSELFESLQSGEFQKTFATIGNVLRIPSSGLPPVRCDHQEFETEYLAAFEVVRNGDTRCSLQERSYSGLGQDIPLPDEASSRGTLMEDLLRFYHHFGLRLVEDPSHRLPPDHLVCQFEMLSYLSLRESMADTDGASAAWYRDAQRDFLRRHLSMWLPEVVNTLDRCPRSSDARQFYFAAAEISLASVTAHLAAIHAPRQNDRPVDCCHIDN